MIDGRDMARANQWAAAEKPEEREKENRRRRMEAGRLH